MVASMVMQNLTDAVYLNGVKYPFLSGLFRALLGFVLVHTLLHHLLIHRKKREISTYQSINQPENVFLFLVIPTLENLHFIFLQFLNKKCFVGGFKIIVVLQKIYSRVGQACKNDQGGTNFLRNQFSSFFKARLNCSLPGQPNFYFDEISDVTDFVTLNSLNKSDEKMVFAIMNTPR